MNSWIIIAIITGLTAAALHATVVTGSPIALVLFYLAPLPLFLAGLGWGPVVAAVGAVIGAIVLGLGIEIKTGIFFLISTGLAPVILSHFALINRPAHAGTSGEGEAGDKDVEWYPEGRLILWCALVACVLMTITVFVVGGSAEGFEAIVQTALDAIVKNMSSQLQADELVMLERAVGSFARFAAPLAATIWLLSTLLNMWIASRILSSSGRSPRPWAPFASYSLPMSAGLVLGGVTLGSFLPGTLGLVALIGLVLMSTVYTIIGLATLHGLTMGSPMRPFILTTTYFALFALMWIVMFPLVILGLIDQQFNLRARRLSGAGPKDD